MSCSHIRLLLLSTALVHAACGDDDGGDTGAGPDAGASADASGNPVEADGAVSAYASHIIQRTCAPNDGPAVRITLGAGHDFETCSVDLDQASVSVEIFLEAYPVEAPATFLFGGAVETGSGYTCPGGDGPCPLAGLGEVHFDTFAEGEGASGTWELTLEQGTQSGSFDATWCEVEGGGPFCG